MSRKVCAGALIKALDDVGIDAWVDQTGGGTATLFSMAVYPVTEQGETYPMPYVCAGPGSYNWHEPARSTFYWEELSVSAGHPNEIAADYVDNIADFVDRWLWWDRAERARVGACSAPTAGYTLADFAAMTPAQRRAVGGG